MINVNLLYGKKQKKSQRRGVIINSICAAIKLINTPFPFLVSASDAKIIHPTGSTDGPWTVALRQAI